MYWALDTTEKKNQFIATWVREEDVRQLTTAKETQRQKSRIYFLPVNGKWIKVGKEYFLARLYICDSKIRNVLPSLPETKCAKGEGQGKHAGRRLPEIYRDIVREHIRSFPTVQSHYCRQDTSCNFLPAELNAEKMYGLYFQYCE